VNPGTGRPAGMAALRAGLGLFVTLVFLYLLLPISVIVPMSFSSQQYLSFPPPAWSARWYRAMLDNPVWLDAALNSFRIGVPTALLSVLFGTLAALGLGRGRFRWSAMGTTLLVAPMMLPHIIIAIGLYPVMLSLGLLNSHLAPVIGHTVVATPLVFVTVSAALRSYDATFEMAAMTLGANWWATFRHVTFPFIRMGMLVGGIFAFATSFDELILSLFLTRAGTRTLPRLMWEQMNDYLTPTIAAASTLVLAFSLLLLAVAALLRRPTAMRSSRAAGAA
jgi:ABC-type spermidine/putrescine transport system permease subunit II